MSPSDKDLYIRACYIQEQRIMEWDEEMIDHIFNRLKEERDNEIARKDNK